VASYSLTVAAAPVVPPAPPPPPTVVVLSPAGVAAGVVGGLYSQALAASGGSGSYTFAVTAGSLPAGLTLSPAGVLSGTPMAPGTFTFAVTATDSAANVGVASYSLTVAATPVVPPAPPPPPTVVVVSPAGVAAGVVGGLYSQALAASGGSGSYTFAVTAGSLPAGLTLSPAGVLTAPRMADLTFTFAVTATDSAANVGVASYSLTVARTAERRPGTPPPPTGIVVSPAGVAAGGGGGVYSQALAASGGRVSCTVALSWGTVTDVV